MDWLYTTVMHGPRKRMGISTNEYCVLDVIYQSQVSPKYGKGGWTTVGVHKLAEFFGLSSGTVHKLLSRMVEAGFLEIDGDLKRTTKKFYEQAYEKVPVQKADVRKVNRRGSKSEPPGVQKVNTKGSKSEPEYNRIENKENNYSHTPQLVDEIEVGVEMNDPFLFQSVAEKMSNFLALNPGQWERMKHDTGYTGTAYDICLTWAGKQDKHTLTRWPQHIGKLTTWMKTEATSKLNNHATNQTAGGFAGQKQQRKSKAVPSVEELQRRYGVL